MTLYTKIAITTPGVDPEAAFTKITDLIGATPEQTARARRTEYAHTHSIDMPVGLGLPALVGVSSSLNDEPIPLEDDETHDLEEAKGDSGRLYTPPAYLVIGMDTSYSYKTPNGAGCGDFHAWLVREMGAWLTEQEASWDWNDESGWGWTVEWKGDETILAQNPGVSAEWGTLGDPDVGEIGSMIPSVTRDQRQAFLEDRVIPALGLDRD